MYIGICEYHHVFCNKISIKDIESVYCDHVTRVETKVLESDHNSDIGLKVLYSRPLKVFTLSDCFSTASRIFLKFLKNFHRFVVVFAFSFLLLS